MASTRQTSFSAGELSPLLHGRTDLELFQHGARKLLNFVVGRQGSAVSRPGTKLVTSALGASVALVPFETAAVTYLLEFGEYYVRVHHPTTGYTGTQMGTPWRAGLLPELQIAQVGDSMVLTHEQVAPQEILLVSSAWLIRPARFTPPGDTPSTAQSMVPVFKTQAGNLVLGPFPVSKTSTSLFVLDAAHPAQEFRWKASSIMRNNLTGEEVETLPVDIAEFFIGEVLTRPNLFTLDSKTANFNLVVVYSAAPVRLVFPAFKPLIGSLFSYANWSPVGVVLYRGRGYGKSGLFGFVLTTRYAQDMIDVGDDPDYLRPPLRGDNPFESIGAPSAVAYSQQRRIYGKGSTWYASEVDAWANFDSPALVYDGCPLEVTMASRRSERIVSLVMLDQLLALTTTSVLAIGERGVPLGVSPSQRLVDEVGAAPMMPLVVDGQLLFVRAKGRGVRAVVTGDAGGYSGHDVTWQSEHLFRSPDSKIVSWCYQRDPFGAIWAALSDGTLLSATRSTGGVWAWARHDVGGKVLSVACVPQPSPGEFDVVFLAVERAGGTKIERMTPVSASIPRHVTHPLYDGNLIGSEQTSYPLDSHVVAVMEGAPSGTPAPTTVSGLGRLEGKDVWASCPGINPHGPMRVVGGAVTVPAGWAPDALVTNFRAAIGLAPTCDLELLDASPGNARQRTVVSVGFEVDNSVGLEAGEDFKHLVPWRQREVSDSYEYPSAASYLVVVQVKGSWRRTGRAVLRQSKPLSLTVLGVTRELDEGGK